MAQKGLTKILLNQGARIRPGALFHPIGAWFDHRGFIDLLEMDVTQENRVISVKPFKGITIWTIVHGAVWEFGFCDGAVKQGNCMGYF